MKKLKNLSVMLCYLLLLEIVKNIEKNIKFFIEFFELIFLSFLIY